MAKSSRSAGILIERHLSAANVVILATLLALSAVFSFVLHSHIPDPFLAVIVFILPTPLYGLLFIPALAAAISLLPPSAFLFFAGIDVLAAYSVIAGLAIIPGAAWLSSEMFRLSDLLKDSQDDFEHVSEARGKLETIVKRDSETQQGSDQKIVSLSSRILYLKSVARSLGATLELGKLLGDLMVACEKALKAQRACLLVQDGDRLVLKATLGWSKGEIVDGYEAAGEMAGQIFETKSLILQKDILNHPRWKELYGRSKLKFMLGAPLGVDGQPIGALIVERMKSNQVEEDDLQIFSILTDLAYLSLRNAALYSQMERMANTDGLTRLFTKRYFLDFMKLEIGRARRYGRTFSILLSDIDHFKHFNDTHGHQAGDFVLKETAAIFSGSVRTADLAARYGGEEFITVLPETDLDGAMIIADRIRKSVEEHEFPFEDKILRVAVSIGVASFPDDGTEIDLLIRRSDQALYAAKKAGRNRVIHCREVPAA